MDSKGDLQTPPRASAPVVGSADPPPDPSCSTVDVPFTDVPPPTTRTSPRAVLRPRCQVALVPGSPTTAPASLHPTAGPRRRPARAERRGAAPGLIDQPRPASSGCGPPPGAAGGASVRGCSRSVPCVGGAVCRRPCRCPCECALLCCAASPPPSIAQRAQYSALLCASARTTLGSRMPIALPGIPHSSLFTD